MLSKWTFTLAAALAIAPPAAYAADTIRIGFVTALSGPFSILGEELQRGFDLAVEQLGGKIGGLPTEVHKANTQAKPDIAVTEMSRLVDRHNVQIVTGILASNVYNAIGPQLNERGVFAISGNAGSSLFAGEGCLPNVFTVSFENDTVNEATALYMNQQGVKSMFTVGLNYQAGKDHIAGAKRNFKGKLVGELYPDIETIDFSSEIAQIRSADPEAVYIFLPGRPGITFIRQFVQAGLDKKIRIFGGSWHADELTFSALGRFATTAKLELGTYWVWSLDNAQNKKFVAAFEKKHGRRPMFMAALQYDAVMLIDSAVRAVKGKVEDKDAFRTALRKADFPSVRGEFKFNVNHYPIQDHYIVRIAKDGEGVLMHELVAKATENHKDHYFAKCPMKW